MFASQPYILDLIAPSKSVGQVIGENARDLIDSLNDKKRLSAPKNSARNSWSNIIMITSFVLFALTVFFSVESFQKRNNKWTGIVGILLSIAGLGIYFSHLAIGLIGFIIIAVLIVIIVLLGT